MEILLNVWSDGDESVGMSGCRHQVTVTIDPAPDFEEMEEDDKEFFVQAIENNMKSTILSLSDYFDADFQIHVQTQKEAELEYLNQRYGE